jgi:hypothetical protein
LTQSGELEENNTFILNCDSGIADSLVDYIWLKDGHKIDPNFLNITIKNKKFIIFNKLDHFKNDGCYTCQVIIKNSGQLIENDILIQVKRIININFILLFFWINFFVLFI